MLSIADMRTLREAWHAGSAIPPAEALANIGNPSPDEIVDSALAHMADGDRNIRVLTLRVLRHQRGEIAMRGVLSGLRDESRRVQTVAIQACPNFLEFGELVGLLESMASDMSLKRKVRRRALSTLAGDEGRMTGEITASVHSALTRLMQNPDCRFAIVFGLARLELGERTKTLLQSFAASGSAAERNMATRALNGERIIHIDAYAQDEALHRRIMQNCDIAHGRMYYWLPRDSE